MASVADQIPANWEQLAFDTIKSIQDTLPAATELAVRGMFAWSLAALFVGILAAILAILSYKWQRSRQIAYEDRHNSREEAWFFSCAVPYIVPIAFSIVAVTNILSRSVWMGIFAPELALVMRVLGW